MSKENKSLKQVYDRSCTRELDPNPKKSAPSIKPSMLGSPCMRKIYYSYNKVPEDTAFPLASSRVVNLGTVIGNMLAEAYYKEGIGIKFRKPDGTYYLDHEGKEDYEFRLTSTDLAIRLGKIDLVHTLDDGLWIAEFKSIHDFGFSGLKAPKPEHLIQGVVYWYLFNLALKAGEYSHIEELKGFDRAQGIRFVYYGKNKSELKEFVVTSADETFRQIVVKIQQVMDLSERKQLPEKTPDFCNSCSWAKKCAANKNID